MRRFTSPHDTSIFVVRRRRASPEQEARMRSDWVRGLQLLLLCAAALSFRGGPSSPFVGNPLARSAHSAGFAAARRFTATRGLLQQRYARPKRAANDEPPLLLRLGEDPPARAKGAVKTSTTRPATLRTGKPAHNKLPITAKPRTQKLMQPTTKAAPSKTASAKAAPTKAAPTKAAPTKAAPTKAAPTKAAPTKAAPTKAAPTKAAPAKAAPTKAAPTKAAATTRIPTAARTLLAKATPAKQKTNIPSTPSITGSVAKKGAVATPLLKVEASDTETAMADADILDSGRRSSPKEVAASLSKRERKVTTTTRPSRPRSKAEPKEPVEQIVTTTTTTDGPIETTTTLSTIKLPKKSKKDGKQYANALAAFDDKEDPALEPFAWYKANRVAKQLEYVREATRDRYELIYMLAVLHHREILEGRLSDDFVKYNISDPSFPELYRNITQGMQPLPWEVPAQATSRTTQFPLPSPPQHDSMSQVFDDLDDFRTGVDQYIKGRPVSQTFLNSTGLNRVLSEQRAHEKYLP